MSRIWYSLEICVTDGRQSYARANLGKNRAAPKHLQDDLTQSFSVRCVDGSGGLSLLTLAAEMRPGHCFEARLRDRLLTDHAYAIRTVSHASERLLNRFQETAVAFVQVDLKLSFRIGIGLVNNIALTAACRWHLG